MGLMGLDSLISGLIVNLLKLVESSEQAKSTVSRRVKAVYFINKELFFVFMKGFLPNEILYFKGYEIISQTLVGHASPLKKAFIFWAHSKDMASLASMLAEPI